MGHRIIPWLPVSAQPAGRYGTMRTGLPNSPIFLSKFPATLPPGCWSRGVCPLIQKKKGIRFLASLCPNLSLESWFQLEESNIVFAFQWVLIQFVFLPPTHCAHKGECAGDRVNKGRGRHSLCSQPPGIAMRFPFDSLSPASANP